MVCQNCLNAGTNNGQGKYALAVEHHSRCDDKGCVCQHKTGPGLIVTRNSKVPLMRTQSP
jgi:hypothetical protein